SAFQYLESPIFFSVSRDGGLTWSAPREISGAARPVCTFSSTPLPYDGRCREDQFAAPVVAPDGTVFVAFENGQAVNDGNLRNQYLVVRSTDGGATWSAPVPLTACAGHVQSRCRRPRGISSIRGRRSHPMAR